MKDIVRVWITSEWAIQFVSTIALSIICTFPLQIILRPNFKTLFNLVPAMEKQPHA